MAGLLLSTVLPNIAVTVGQAGMDVGGIKVPEDKTPVFRSSVTVWNPAWLLIALLLGWFVLSKGGKK